jgi:hypothetical protein
MLFSNNPFEYVKFIEENIDPSKTIILDYTEE